VTVAMRLHSGGIATDVEIPERFEYLPPDELACFAVEYDGTPNVDSYEMHGWFAYTTSAARSAPLEARDVTGAVTPESNYELRGVLENIQPFAVDGVILNGTLYNAAGAVIGCVAKSVPGLQPGEESLFTILFDTRASYTEVAGFRVTAYGVEATR
jgi:hypothetical protein